MAESAPEQTLGTPQKHLPTCDKHRGLIDIFCEDCDEFICTDCAKTDHKDHNWATIVTAASQRRRQLFGFIQTIKEEKVPKLDRNIEMAPTKMKENEIQADGEIQTLRKHFDEIIARLTEIKSKHEKNLRDNAIKKNEQVSQYQKQKKSLVEMVKLMEENNSTMSDYKLINHHRDLSNLVSAVDVDMEICEFSLKYAHREICDDEVDLLMGKIVDLKDFDVTETNSFQYGDKGVSILEAFDENECYIQFNESEYIERINIQGDKKHKHNIAANDMCVTDTSDVYFADSKYNGIARVYPNGYVSTVFSTHPLVPMGICQSLDGGFLVSLIGTESEMYTDSPDRRLVRHMSITGGVIREYEYQKDGQTRLFKWPYNVRQNGNSDICVLNHTSDTTGNLVILSSSGRLRYVYRGQNLKKDFCPYDVVYDFCDNIIVTDGCNHCLHLLSPDGEFVKFLLTKNELYHPTALSLYGSTLLVGNYIGTVKCFRFEY